jgi:hypothetical protein
MSWMIPKIDSYQLRKLKKDNIRELYKLEFVDNISIIVPFFNEVPRNNSLFNKVLDKVHWRDRNNVRVLFDELYDEKYKTSVSDIQFQNETFDKDENASSELSDQSYEFLDGSDYDDYY